jgi:hypothetical protein
MNRERQVFCEALGNVVGMVESALSATPGVHGGRHKGEGLRGWFFSQVLFEETGKILYERASEFSVSPVFVTTDHSIDRKPVLPGNPGPDKRWWVEQAFTAKARHR